MGLMSWLFPKPADKVAKARRLIAEGRFAEARHAVEGVDHPDAEGLLAEAARGLVRLNLETAVQNARGGNEAQVESNLERAAHFHDGSMQALFDETAARLAEVRRVRDQERAWTDLAALAERRRRLGVDPGDFSWVAFNEDGAIQLVMDNDGSGLPHLVVQPDAAVFRPAEIAEPEVAGAPTDEEVRAALQALRRMYPRDLPQQVDAAGEPLARAVLEVVAGRPEHAIPRLLKLPADNAAVRFELARAASALGAQRAADVALAQFAEMTGGHQQVGKVHSGELHAQVVAWLGETARALDIVRAARQGAPDRGLHLFVALAIEEGQLIEAEKALDRLKRKSARDPRLPQLVTALSLRQTVAALAAELPVLRGEVPADPAEAARQQKEASERVKAAVEKALSELSE